MVLVDVDFFLFIFCMQSHPELSKSSSTHGEEGEGDTCSICFEAWTTAGQHRLSALRCGHLFGYTCIVRWLKAQGTAAKCPQVPPVQHQVDEDALCWPLTRALFFFLSAVQQESQAFGRGPAVRTEAEGTG